MPVHACIVGSLGILGKGVRRHGENRHRPHIGLYGPADGARGLVSVHHGHHDVHQNSVEAAGGPVDEGVECLATVRGARDRHALIGKQLRQLYALRCGLDAGRSRRDVKELCGVSYDFVFDKLSAAAQSYSAETLAELVALSAEYDFRMKGGDSKADPAALLRELFARIAAAK